MNTEMFIPYNQLKDYMIVSFVELKGDSMIVSYQDKDYELTWNNHYQYYSGKVGSEQGYIP